MYKKIYKNFCFLSIGILLTIAVFIIIILYTTIGNDYKKEIENDTVVLSEIIKLEGENYQQKIEELGTKIEKRITLISEDGTVLYDNMNNMEEMEKHNERPEIIQAKLEGRGQAERYSITNKVVTYYYAIKLEDGNILRLAIEKKTLYTVISREIITILIMLSITSIISIIISKKLTKNIVEPIKNMDDADNDKNIYPELKPYIEQKRKNEQIRKQFSSNVSHELKTPLTTILGYSQLINNGIAKKEDIKKFTRKIEKEAIRLIKLIDNIIYLSKVEEDNRKSQKQEISLKNAVEEVIERLQEKIEEKQIEVTINSDNSTAIGNLSEIEEMLYNICENAIKYNKDKGSITIELQNKKITIEDTGIGIEEQKIDRIFERFYRIDTSHSKKIEGTGLGLSIVKHIAQKNSATIEVKSEVGKGTIFIITFD